MISSKQLKILLIIISLLIATTSGYFSVIGLSSIFGSGTFIFIMSSLLETSKIISVSFISSIYFKSLNKIIKTYILIVTILLMIITSFGVYGYLSSSYQTVYNKLNESTINLNRIEEVINESNNNIKYLKEINVKLQKNIDDINKISDRTNSSALEYITDKNYNRMLKSLNKNSEVSLNQIKNITNEINSNNFKINSINDTLLVFNNEKNKINLILNSNSDISTLKFLSSLLSLEYNYIVNILILIIVFSFDPLAISLLISANNIKDLVDEEIKENIISKEFIVEDSNIEDSRIDNKPINIPIIEEVQEEIQNDVYNEFPKNKEVLNKITGELNDYNFIN